jgi:prefoldin subunit 5
MITCNQCKTTTDTSKFVDHLLETNLKCLNASYRQRLWNGSIVALDIPVQKDGSKCDVFVCLVCKTCKELDICKDFVEERKEFVENHTSRCGSRFSEIEHHIKPSAIELYEAQKVLKQKKHPSCLKCGYDANGNEYNLRRHIATCQGPKVKVKKCCEKCGYDGKGNTSNLSRHIATCKGPKAQTTPQNTVVFAESERASKTPDWIHKQLCEVKDHYEIDIDDEDYTDEDLFNMLFQDVKKADENMNRAVAKQQARCDAFTKEVSDLKDELFELCCLIQSIRREDRGIVSKLAAPTTMGIVTRIVGETDDDGFSDSKDERTQLQKMDEQLYERDHTISILKHEIKKLKKHAEEKDAVIETFKTIKIKGGSGSDSSSDSDWD